MKTQKQIVEELQRETAWSRFNEQRYRLESNFERVKRFHQAMGLTVREVPETPTVSERILRAKLLIEETLETIYKGLGVVLTYEGEPLRAESIGVTHLEGLIYDPIETLDGLADVKVISNGTAVAFGLPMDEADYEVFCSNMTKLDEQGNPVVNRCTACHPVERDIPRENLLCIDEDHRLTSWLDGDKPIGKLLKSSQYVEANIARIIVDFQPDDEMERTRNWLVNTGSHES